MLQGILFDGISLTSELLPVKPTLKILALGGNEIQYFPFHYFRGFQALVMLNIAQNEIFSAPNTGYIGHSLKIFNIANNKLKILDNRLTGGKNMTALENLWVQNNEIRHFDVSTLIQMPVLNDLNLVNNHLQHIADPTVYLHPLNVSGWPLILTLDFNPPTCAKEISWLIILAKQGRIEDTIVNREAKCHRQLCMKDRGVMSLCKYGENVKSFDPSYLAFDSER